MTFFTVILGIFFTLLSTAILTYVSIATMVGPWIAPTIVLIAGIVMKFYAKDMSDLSIRKKLTMIQAIAGGGGIIAVGVGFSLPILYFLNPTGFLICLSHPVKFCLLVMGICLAAGSLGIFLGRCFSRKFLEDEKLPFPVSQLTYKVIEAQNQSFQGKSMLVGVLGSLSFNSLRDGLFGFSGLFPKHYTLFSTFCGRGITFSLWPMLWAIGYTIGPFVCIPLLIGLASRCLILTPLNHHSLYLPFKLFEPMSISAFITPFCSGLVLFEVLFGIFKNPQRFFGRIGQYFNGLYHIRALSFNEKTKIRHCLEPLFAIGSSIAILTYLNFSLPAQIALIIFTMIATYEICFIGCEIGLLQLGRFSAFVLIPMMLLFNLNFHQITAICVFFNICAATSSDLLFDYKTGSYCGIKRSHLDLAQWLGLLVTSMSIGLILYLLFTNFQLGSQELCAMRSQSKALLVQSFNLDWHILTMGFLYAIILKICRISPSMTLGGIIMPSNITLGLVLGGLLSLPPKQKDRYLPFCAGIFASESLWVLITLIVKMF